MDGLIVFVCLFVPTFLLNYLGAGRAELLAEARKGAHPLVVIAASFAAVILVHILGFSWGWALALVTPGPLGSLLGEWFGQGGGIVARFRLRQLGDRLRGLGRRGG